MQGNGHALQQYIRGTSEVAITVYVYQHWNRWNIETTHYFLEIRQNIWLSSKQDYIISL